MENSGHLMDIKKYQPWGLGRRCAGVCKPIALGSSSRCTAAHGGGGPCHPCPSAVAPPCNRPLWYHGTMKTYDLAEAVNQIGQWRSKLAKRTCSMHLTRSCFYLKKKNVDRGARITMASRWPGAGCKQKAASQGPPTESLHVAVAEIWPLHFERRICLGNYGMKLLNMAMLCSDPAGIDAPSEPAERERLEAQWKVKHY